MLAWTKERTADWIRVAFYGHLTEEANLVVLGRELGGGRVILDLGGIRWVNSWGVSKWVDFVGALRAQETVIAFNRFSQVDPAGPFDLGLGRSPGGNPDWTFVSNSATFTTRRLEVYVREE